MIDDIIQEYQHVLMNSKVRIDAVPVLMLVDRIDRLNRKIDDLIKIQARKQ